MKQSPTLRVKHQRAMPVYQHQALEAVIQYLQLPLNAVNRASKSVVGVPCPGGREMTSMDLHFVKYSQLNV